MKLINVRDVPGLLAVANSVHESGEPVIVVQPNGNPLAVIVPLKAAAAQKTTSARSDDAYAAFLSAAGTWSDVDTDALIDAIRTHRATPGRPPVAL